MKVSVDILFSKNDKVGSKLIQWGSNHQYPQIEKTPSHVAVLINNRWVFESTLFTGIRVIPYKKWREINTELYKYRHSEMEYSKVKSTYKKLQDKKYDWSGVLYLGIMLMANKFFKKPMPQTNKWEGKDLYFCSEAVATIIGLSNHAMKTPVDVMVWTDYLLR